MTERERCQSPDADGRWCEFVGDNGGPYRCIRCGKTMGRSLPTAPPLREYQNQMIEPTGMRCEIKAGDGKDSRCTRTDTVYRRGKWVCPTHGPEPDAEPRCSHSAVMWGRCSYCGTTITNQPQGEQTDGN